MRPTNSRREQPMGLNIQQRMHGPVHQAHPKFFVRDKAIHTSTLNFNPVLYSFYSIVLHIYSPLYPTTHYFILFYIQESFPSLPMHAAWSNK
jgi:hypothetical protein